VGPLPGAMVIDGTSNGSKLFRPTSLNGLVSCPTASSTACAKHSPKSLRFRLHFLKLEAKRSCRQRPTKIRTTHGAWYKWRNFPEEATRRRSQSCSLYNETQTVGKNCILQVYVEKERYLFFHYRYMHMVEGLFFHL
jgi:hypothetical protein